MKNKYLRLRQTVFSLGSLVTLFFIARLINLTLLPIFTDEAIYLRWAQIAKNDASWRFISLTDGKQPLFVWLTMVSMKFLKDQLFAGRLVSVLAGLASMVGIFLLGSQLFKSKKVGLLSSLLYFLCPFTLMYDRMALMDALVATFAIWSLYFEILLVRTLRLDVALILGMVLGGGILTKTSGFFNIYLLPASLILFNFRDKKWKSNLIKWFGLALLAVVMSQGYYSVLRLSPFFHMIAQKDTTFVYPFAEWLQHPFRFFVGNLKGQFDWLVTYLTLPVVFLILVSLFIFWKRLPEKTLLFTWFFVPFVALALFGKVLYARFLLFMGVSLLVLGAWSLKEIVEKIEKKTLLLYCFIALLFAWPLYVDYKILFDPTNAPIPQSDLNQYINDWPAGGGVREVVAYLEDKASKEPIFVGTEGTFGLFPASLELYLIDNPNIEIKGYWPLGEQTVKELKDKASKKPTFLVLKETQEVPPDWPLKLIFKIRKGKGESFLHFYQVAI